MIKKTSSNQSCGRDREKHPQINHVEETEKVKWAHCICALFAISDDIFCAHFAISFLHTIFTPPIRAIID